jgi:hypothetical protein
MKFAHILKIIAGFGGYNEQLIQFKCPPKYSQPGSKAITRAKTGGLKRFSDASGKGMQPNRIYAFQAMLKMGAENL